MPNDTFHGDAVGRHGGTVFASAARTATPNTQEIEVGPRWTGLTLVIDTTAAGTSPSTVFKVEGVDRISGKTYGALSSAAVTGVGTVTLSVGPGLPVTANVSANQPVPPVVRVTATHGNSTTHTYSVALILS